MFRIVFNALIIAIASNIVLEIMPWWTVIFVAFIVLLLFRLPAKSAFLSGALGGGLCFLVASLYADIINGGLLSGRIAELFKLPSPIIILLITTFIGLISGGLGGLLANKLVLLFKPSQGK